ncbi:hypothetical protein FEN17_04175 [Dyadobacter luticola]|uniref:Uncharacterized protein n=2 Tax=Dyadobacter luticola TaxID=1979387 RepID=A0A5R9L6N5_9BACT|nr:hypothetical protein FEN17_04175 [Dyadobacter luticola]
MIGTLVLLCLVCRFDGACFAQCKEKISESNNETIHYQNIPLGGKNEYLTLSSQGDEKMFSYSNENIDLVFHVPMFTEVKFTTKKGKFSLYATTSNRTRWKTCFTLSAPLSPREIEKMRDVTKVEILLPEDHKVFSLDQQKSVKFGQALACLF